jgi:hypothetical protein
MLQRQLVEHRRQAEDRRPGRIDHDLIDIDKGRGAVFFADMQLVQLQSERVGIQVYGIDSDGAAQHGGCPALQLALDQRRGSEETQHAEQHDQAKQNQKGFAQSVRAIEPDSAVAACREAGIADGVVHDGQCSADIASRRCMAVLPYTSRELPACLG